jgi:hypothetical protein
MRKFKERFDKNYGLKVKAAGLIAGAILCMQRKFSDSMSKAVSKISLKKMKLLVIIFCVVTGGYSMYLIVYSIIRPHESLMKVDKINVPKHALQHGDPVRSSTLVSGELYHTIRMYERYMDSLGLAIRPGLLDSIKTFKEIYQSQKIK